MDERATAQVSAGDMTTRKMIICTIAQYSQKIRSQSPVSDSISCVYTLSSCNTPHSNRPAVVVENTRAISEEARTAVEREWVFELNLGGEWWSRVPFIIMGYILYNSILTG